MIEMFLVAFDVDKDVSLVKGLHTRDCITFRYKKGFNFPTHQLTLALVTLRVKLDVNHINAELLKDLQSLRK